ncbi:MAG: outer membrane beta-barrel protein [Acidobacteria bacterium]|nr:outer membrane beta-barrel protein [Acidobacteriota bacterium]
MRRLIWVGCLFLAVVGVAAYAGDGIPMGNAIFYPSVEAVYTHTDNLFLLDKNEPGGEFSDSFWLIRPTLGFELPMKESYVKFNLSYQYKDYDKYQISTHDAWFADFDSKWAFSNGGDIYFRNHYVRGVTEVNQFDPNYEATFGNARFDHDYAQLGVELPINKLNTLGIEAGYNYVDFSNSDESYIPFYGYEQWMGTLRWKYHYSPESSWIFEYNYTDSKPRSNALDYTLMTTLDKKYTANTFMFGWEGSLAHRLSGFAKAGFEEMRFDNNNYSDYSGFVAEAGLGMQFAEFVRGDLNIYRRASQSAFNVNNYYTATGAEFQIHHQVTKYFFWAAGYMYQENRYPDAIKADVNGDGFVDALLYLWTAGQDRKDKISRARGEIGFHFTQQLSLRLNYQYEDRNSNVSYVDTLGISHKPYSYTENRFAFQMQLGW